MSQNKKRPVYNSSQGEIEAMRILPPEEAEVLNPSPFWKKMPNWVRQITGLSKKPPGSGFGYIYPPYYSIYNLVYGLLPIADLPKYRILYRGEPDLKAGIDLIVNLATAKGFTVEYEHEASRKMIEDVIDRVDLGPAFQIIARDSLIFGNAFLEVIWDESEEEDSETELPHELMSFIKKDFPILEGQLKDSKNVPDTAFLAVKELEPSIASWKKAFAEKKVYQRNGKYYCKAAKLVKGKSKNVVGVKALDPVYMRVRADPFGLVYGYIQWLQWPPAVIDTDSLIHFKNSPTSEAYQTVYGQSQFLPLIRNTDLLHLFDQDVANWIHNQAVIPLWVQAGATPEKPYSTDQLRALVGDWANRTAATTVFTKSDVKIAVLKGGGRDLKVDWWQKYLLDRRMLALGVPPLFLGVTQGIGRATGEVMLSDFVARIQSLQNHISAMVVNRLFVPLIISNFGEETIDQYGEPQLIWKPIIEEDRNKRLLNIDRLAVDGIISVNEARTSVGWQPFRRPMKERKEQQEMTPGETPIGTNDYDPNYDEPRLLRVPPQMGQLGMPQKPTDKLKQMNPDKAGLSQDKQKDGQPKNQQKDTPEEKSTEQDSGQNKKSEDIKLRAFQISNDLFQKELEDILGEVAFEVKQGGVLVKDIRSKYNSKASKVISKWIDESELKTIDKKKLKEKYVKDITELIEDKIAG